MQEAGQQDQDQLQLTRIEFTPSFKTLTASGKSHFSRVSDALAEFIDNSIQATKRSGRLEAADGSGSSQMRPTRKVTIKLLLSDAEKYIVIADNGEGMGPRELTHFATFALDQESRSTPSSQFISKFGVGAKQAGFFLGDKLCITTRRLGENSILELDLDEEEFERRERNREAVFQDTIRARKPRSEPSTLPRTTNSPSLDAFILNYELENPHFTIIAIRIRPFVLSGLERDERESNIPMVNKLGKELADIYYFHLHSECIPREALNMAHHREAWNNVYKTKKGPRRFEPTPPRTAFDHVASHGLPLEITLEVRPRWGPVRPELSLGDVDCGPRRIVHAKEVATPFYFNLEIPDPDPNDISSTRDIKAVQKDNLNYNTMMTGSAAKTCLVEGIIFYFPTKNGCTTIPDTSSVVPRHLSHTAAQEVRSSQASGAAASAVQEDFGILSAAVGGPMCSVYWQDRLVPETEITSLPFFPEWRLARICEQNNVPVDWRDRIRGFLFFGWDFHHISNNKLKFQVDPNMDEWLNNKRRYRSEIKTMPMKLSEHFQSWLQFCHENFDEDCTLSEPEPSDPDTTRFGKLQMGLNANKVIVKKEDKVKLKIDRSLVAVEISYFLIRQALPPSQKEFNGTDAKIFFRRVPFAVFGTDIVESAELSSLDLKKCKVTEDDLRGIKKRSVCNARFITLHNEKRTDVASDAIFVAEGRLQYLGIQLVNGLGHAVTTLPDSPSRRLTVSMNLCDVLGNVIRPMGVCATPMTVSGLTGGVNDAEKYYFFKDIKEKPGEYHVIIRALDSAREVYTKTLKIHFASGAPSRFKIAFANINLGEIRLGDFLPDFKILFLDDTGSLTQLREQDNMAVELLSPGLELSCDGIDQHPWMFEVEKGESSMEFEDGIWSAEPKCEDKSDAQFFKNGESEKTCVFTLACTPFPNTETFSLRFIPGHPSSVRFIRPAEPQEVSIEGESMTASIVLGAFDKYGHQTLPRRGRKWILSSTGRSGVFPPNSEFPMQTDGTITITGLSPNMSSRNIPEGGMVIEELFELKQASAATEPWTGVPSIPISFRIFPQRVPTELKISMSGRCISDGQMLSCRVGSILKELSFEVLDASQRVINDLGAFGCSVESLWISWGERTGARSSGAAPGPKKGKKDAAQLLRSSSLPDVEIPVFLELFHRDYEVKLNIPRIGELSSSFQVRIVPDEPVAWKILYSGDPLDGIMLGDENEIANKIIGVSLIDQHGNLISPDFAKPKPQLSLKGLGFFDIIVVDQGAGGSCKQAELEVRRSAQMRNSESSEVEDGEWAVDIPLVNGEVDLWAPDGQCLWENGIMIQPKTPASSSRKSTKEPSDQESEALSNRRPKLHCYVLGSSKLTLEGSLPVVGGSNVQWHVSSSTAGIKDCDIESVVVAGRPHIVLARQQGTGDFSNHLALVLPSTQDHLNLELQLRDKGGNVPAFQNKLHSIQISVKTSGSEDEIVSKKITAKSAVIPLPSIKISKLRKAAGQSNVLELRCVAVLAIQGQEAYELDGAIVSCSILTSNRVVALDIDAERGGISRSSLSQPTQPDYFMDVDDQGEAASNATPLQFSFNVMSQFNVIIRTVTEDGVAFVPAPDAIEISTNFMRVPSDQTISKPIGVFIPSASLFKGRPVPFTSLFRPVTATADRLIFERVNAASHPDEAALDASSSFVCPDVGLYEVVISYTEKRAQYAATNSKKISRKVYFLLVAGKPAAISLCDHNPMLSHVSLGQPAATDLKVQLIDKWKNKSLNSAAETLSIRCFIDASVSDRIVLRTTDSTGVLTARKDGGDFAFGPIVLEVKRGDADDEIPEGVAHLIIESSDSRIQRLELPIQYHSDQAQAAKLQQLALELSQQERVVSDFSSELASAESRISSKRGELQAILRHLESEQCSFDATQRSGDLPSASDISEQIQVLRREISDIQSAATQFRRSVKPGSAECIAHATAFCCNLVVDSIFIRAEADTSIISWAAMQYIDALIVKTPTDARRIVSSGASGVKVLTVDNRPSPALNLRGIPGNPELMESMVDADDECGGAALKSAIFRNFILFRSLDDMVSALTEVQRRMEPGAYFELFSLDGYRVTSRGVWERAPARMPFLFGEQSPLNSEGYRRNIRVVALLEHALSVHTSLSDLLSKRAQIADFGHVRASAARHRMQELADEIRALNDAGAAGRGGRGEALAERSNPPSKRQKYS